MLTRILVRFGEAPKYYWQKEVRPATRAVLRSTIEPYSLYLSRLSADRLTQIRRELPALIERSRNEDGLRQRLRELFGVVPTHSGDHDYRKETWPKDFEFLDSLFADNGISAEPFSIAYAGTRVSAFFATQKEGVGEQRPIVFLLSGNPPGTKENQAPTALYLATLGYHAVGVDRRPTSWILDTKAKFLTNYSDPVRDLLRLIGYFSEKYPRSRIGLYMTA